MRKLFLLAGIDEGETFRSRYAVIIWPAKPTARPAHREQCTARRLNRRPLAFRRPPANVLTRDRLGDAVTNFLEMCARRIAISGMVAEIRLDQNRGLLGGIQKCQIAAILGPSIGETARKRNRLRYLSRQLILRYIKHLGAMRRMVIAV